jgi:probable HAF family extracellular repeat protein
MAKFAQTGLELASRTGTMQRGFTKLGYPRRLRLSLTSAFLLLACGNASAVEYAFKDLGTLGGNMSQAFGVNNTGQVVGSSNISLNGTQLATLWSGNGATTLTLSGTTDSAANAINNRGQIVGQAAFGGSAQHAALWNGTAVTDLGTLGGSSSTALAINDAGQVVGVSVISGNQGYGHATLWNGSLPTDLGTLGGNLSQAYGINNTGQVAGWATGADGLPHATLWTGGVATDLGTLGGSDSQAYAINNAGQVVGLSRLPQSGFVHATIWNGTTATDLGALGDSDSVARAINSAGEIVGWSFITGQGNHATLWNGTSAIDLNSALDSITKSEGWVLTFANGINDNGWITGTAQNAAGETHAFLLSPVPEPLSSYLIISGLAVLCLARPRKPRKMTDTPYGLANNA